MIQLKVTRENTTSTPSTCPEKQFSQDIDYQCKSKVDIRQKQTADQQKLFSFLFFARPSFMNRPIVSWKTLSFYTFHARRLHKTHSKQTEITLPQFTTQPKRHIKRNYCVIHLADKQIIIYICRRYTGQQKKMQNRRKCAPYFFS